MNDCGRQKFTHPLRRLMGTRKCATYTLPFEYIRGLKSNSGKAGSGAYTHGLLGLLGFRAKSSSLPQPLAGACRAAQDGLRLANLGCPSRGLACSCQPAWLGSFWVRRALAAAWTTCPEDPHPPKPPETAPAAPALGSWSKESKLGSHADSIHQDE